jgi:DNA polymerase-3 subunit epsilon
MLTSAPKFLSRRIIEITNDCVVVAHNADFDYRILKQNFAAWGMILIPKHFTVELSKKLMPEQLSHSLGKLVRALGIPMADRHRASGDAMATVKLFKMLLDKDLEKKSLKTS